MQESEGESTGRGWAAGAVEQEVGNLHIRNETKFWDTVYSNLLPHFNG